MLPYQLWRRQFNCFAVHLRNTLGTDDVLIFE